MTKNTIFLLRLKKKIITKETLFKRVMNLHSRYRNRNIRMINTVMIYVGIKIELNYLNNNNNNNYKYE